MTKQNTLIGKFLEKMRVKQAPKKDKVSEDLSKKIEESFSKDEKIIYSTEGVIKNSKGPLVLTNKAVYFEGKVLWERESEMIPLTKIVSVSNSSGYALSEIKIKTQGESLIIKNMLKKDSEGFVKAYNNFIKENS